MLEYVSGLGGSSSNIRLFTELGSRSDSDSESESMLKVWKARYEEKHY